MRRNAKWFLLVLLVVGIADQTREVAVPQPALSSLPIAFEVNEGQTDASVKYLARGPGYGLFLTPEEAVLNAGGQAVRMKLVGANPAPRIEGEDRLPGKVNYFKGNDPDKWRTNITTYRKVRYHEVYPGIDLVYYGKQGELEYDFVVEPGADPGQIALRLDEEFQLDPGGDLVLATESGELRQKRPVVYQGDRPIDGEFVMLDDGAVGFEVGAYDASLPLVIDPVVYYATYIGGSAYDGIGTNVALDASGNFYFAGSTYSTDFPVESAVQPVLAGIYDGFVLKLNSLGTQVVFATYLGGSRKDFAGSVALDANRNILVAGYTSSVDFPVVQAYQSLHGGVFDAFLTRLGPDGDVIDFSTFVGGSGRDYSWSLTLDSAEYIYLIGETASPEFPLKDPIQSNYGGGAADAFLAKFEPSGQALIYSTFLGGSGMDYPYDIELDGQGNVVICGSTDSADFPTQNPVQADYAGIGTTWNWGGDIFVSKIDAAGTSLIFSTYVGGTGTDFSTALTVDDHGDVFVIGATDSLDFPITPGCFQETGSGTLDAIAFKLASAGNSLHYSTYLRGSTYDGPYGIELDESGRLFVSGFTFSADFPVVDPIQAVHAGGDSDAFLTQLSADGSSVVFSTFYGGNGRDDGFGLVRNAAGVLHWVGQSYSSDFPVKNALQSALAGDTDLFVIKLGPEDGDGDGLLDEWEIYGYTHTNGEYVDLPAMGADPLRKDLFVEVDYMAGFQPGEAALQEVVTAFAAAPVDNPDDTTGITLHFVIDEEIAHVSPLGTLDGGNYVWTRPDGSGVTHFDDLKADHFAEELEWAVRYCIWADSIPGDFSGMSRGIEASDLIVSLGPFIEEAGGTVDPRWESGTFMHELGHNLGLKHGGSDDVANKPNYLSVMNPSFQLEGLYFQGTRGHWDFSFERLPDLDEIALDERIGLQGTTAVDPFGTTWWMDGLPPVLAQQWVSNVNDPINWWNESTFGQEDDYKLLPDPLDVNDSPNGEIELLIGYDDWGHITFTGGEVGGGVALPPPPETPAEEQTLEEVQDFVLAEQVTGLKGHDPNKMYTLTWNPIKPQSQMTEYRVYRDGTQIAATTNTNYKDQEINPGDSHVYWITWVNLLGQESVPGNKVTIGG